MDCPEPQFLQLQNRDVPTAELLRLSNVSALGHLEPHGHPLGIGMEKLNHRLKKLLFIIGLYVTPLARASCSPIRTSWRYVALCSKGTLQL